MTTNNAIAFLVLGLGMFLAPVEFPQFFPPNAMDGSCTSALWLGLMGALQLAMGAGFAAYNETVRLQAAIHAWDPLERPFDLAQLRWAMPASLYAAAGDWRVEDLDWRAADALTAA